MSQKSHPKSASHSTLSHAYRWQVCSRIAAAIIGGYCLASAITILLILLWPDSTVYAFLGASMLFFAWFCAAIIWVFATASAKRAWYGMIISTAGISLLCYFFLPAQSIS